MFECACSIHVLLAHTCAALSAGVVSCISIYSSGHCRYQPGKPTLLCSSCSCLRLLSRSAEEASRLDSCSVRVCTLPAHASDSRETTSESAWLSALPCQHCAQPQVRWTHSAAIHVHGSLQHAPYHAIQVPPTCELVPACGGCCQQLLQLSQLGLQGSLGLGQACLRRTQL